MIEIHIIFNVPWNLAVSVPIMFLMCDVVACIISENSFLTIFSNFRSISREQQDFLDLQIFKPSPVDMEIKDEGRI